MIGFATLGTTASASLFASRDGSVLIAALSWIEGTLLGSLATIVAILAVAGIGFLLLQGRLVVRGGLRVLAGCFILFGAASIVSGLQSFAAGMVGSGAFERPAPQQISLSEPMEIPDRTSNYDPYAGAAVQDP